MEVLNQGDLGKTNPVNIEKITITIETDSDEKRSCISKYQEYIDMKNNFNINMFDLVIKGLISDIEKSREDN